MIPTVLDSIIRCEIEATMRSIVFITASFAAATGSVHALSFDIRSHLVARLDVCRAKVAIDVGSLR